MTSYALTYNGRGSMIALGATLIALATLAMALRIVSNRKYVKNIEIYDLFILPAYVCLPSFARGR